METAIETLFSRLHLLLILIVVSAALGALIVFFFTWYAGDPPDRPDMRGFFLIFTAVAGGLILGLLLYLFS